MEMALTFNGITLSPVTHQNSLWIRAAELARALGYKDDSSVRKIYERNADEFTPDMTQLIEISDRVNLTVSENLKTKVRIFSLRGCHLLAMFARTPVAKAFRRWVLDVLDRLAEEEHAKAEPVGNPDKLPDAPITPDQQCTLQAMVKALVEKGGIYAAIWSRFNNHFRLGSYRQLPQSRMSDAVDYLMRYEVKPKALPPTDEESPELAPPSTSLSFRADFPADMGSDRKEAMQRMERIARDMRTSFSVVRNIVRIGCHPGGYSMNRSLSEREAYRILENFHVAADESLAAAYNALEAGYRFGRLVGRG